MSAPRIAAVGTAVPPHRFTQTDILARWVGEKMTENWGQQVVVDNRPSAGGTIASQYVLSAAPAGHVMGRVFEQMEELFRQRLHVRALGAYLLDVARATGVLRHTGRSLALTVGGEKGEAGEVFVIAS